MKKIDLALLLTVMVFSGCVSSYQPDIETYRSPLTRQRTDRIVDNLVAGPETGGDMVWLNAYRTFKDGYNAEYYLEVLYAATTDLGYLDIGLGTTLLLTVDGKEFRFSGSGSLNLRKKQGTLLNETALYRVQAGDLHAIGNARQVKFKIVGRERSVERECSTVNLARFKKFADEFAAP
jgi:hypothetical protein